MHIRGTTRIAELLHFHPDVVGVFDWYDVLLDEDDAAMTLWQLSITYEIDLDELLFELRIAAEEEDAEDLLSEFEDEREDDLEDEREDDDEELPAVASSPRGDPA